MAALATAGSLTATEGFANADQAEKNQLQLTAFRASVFAAVQPSGSFALGPQVSWNPRYHRDDKLSFVGNTGLLMMKNTFGSIFPAFEYQAMAGFSLTSELSLETGLGGQYWADPEGAANAPTLTFNLVEHSLPADDSLIASIFGGVTLVSMPSDKTYLLRVGIGF